MEPLVLKSFEKQPANCEIHGDYMAVSLRDRLTGCPTCSEESRREREREKGEEERRERVEAWIARSGLEGRFYEARFDNYRVSGEQQAKVLEACRAFAASVKSDSGTSLWLIGPPGTGKTHLGSSMVRHLIEERDQMAAIFSGREIIRSLRATWGQKGPRGFRGQATTEEQLLDDLGRMTLLVIDEIGMNFGSDAEQVQLFDVIDLRYKHRRPTVLMSNLTTKELKGAIGERAYDRLREGAQVLPCNWESYRGRPARQNMESVR